MRARRHLTIARHGGAAMVLLGVACGAPRERLAPPDGVTLAIIGGTVLPMASTPPLEDGVVLVAGDTIVHVGARAEVALPEGPGVEVIDASGQWVIPGLMDLHTHPGSYEGDEQRAALETLLALGITTIRSTSVTRHGGGPELKARLASGELVGPRAWVAGPLIDRRGSQFDFAAMVETEDEIRAEVRTQARSGVDYIKLYSRLDRPLVAAAIDEARSLGLKTLGHLGRTGWMEAARLGIDGLTHSGVMGPTWELLPDPDQPEFREVFAPGSTMADDLYERWVHTLPPAPGKVEELIAVLKAHEVEVNPNLVLGWAIVYGREQSTFDALDTHLAPDSDRQAWRSGPPSPMAGPAELMPLDVRMYAATEALVRQMHEAGLLLTAGSDFPMDWMTPGVSLHVELQRLQAAGIPAAEVLRIATANGARALGVSDRLGSLEPGKLADLVVVSADPRLDIANTRAIATVVKGGRVYQPGDLLAHTR